MRMAGTDPTNAASRFTAKIEMRGSEPVVTWEPDLNENGTKSERVYTIEGRPDLSADWHSPTNASDRFFRVKVGMPRQP